MPAFNVYVTWRACDGKLSRVMWASSWARVEVCSGCLSNTLCGEMVGTNVWAGMGQEQLNEVVTVYWVSGLCGGGGSNCLVLGLCTV
jgi:hypothetical protein